MIRKLTKRTKPMQQENEIANINELDTQHHFFVVKLLKLFNGTMSYK